MSLSFPKVFIIFLNILPILQISLSNYPRKREEILAVVQYNRHGARVRKGKSGEVLSQIFGADEELTPNGEAQQILLGSYMRLKYVREKGFLSENYGGSEFEIASTLKQRTIFSALGFVLGLYPGSVPKIVYQNGSKLEGVRSEDDVPFKLNKEQDTIQNNNQSQTIVNLNFTFIPITVLSYKHDIFYRDECLLDGTKISEIIKKNREENTPIFNIETKDIEEASVALAKVFNSSIPKEPKTIKSGKFLKYILQNFQPFFYHRDKKLSDFPELSPQIIKTIKKFILNQKYFYRIKFGDERKQKEIFENQKLLTSEIFFDLLGKFNRTVNGEQTPKYSVYSVHDSNLINIIVNLMQYDIIKEYIQSAIDDQNKYDFLRPPYASALIFELIRKDGGLYVRITYNGNAINKGIRFLNDELIEDDLIKYEDFVYVIKNLINEDYRKLDCDERYKNDDNLNEHVGRIETD